MNTSTPPPNPARILVIGSAVFLVGFLLMAVAMTMAGRHDADTFTDCLKVKSAQFCD